jgi:hypothetical protein
MRIKMWGSGSVDAIAIQEEPQEVLYLSNTLQYKDGKSDLYRVDLDLQANQANLTLLPNGNLNFDQIDDIAATPDGSRIYMIDDLGTQMLAYYDVASASVVDVGVLNLAGETFFGKVDQAAFSPDGTLYIASTLTDKVYWVDLTTAEAIEVGLVINQATGAVVNIQGADIAFSADGVPYLWVNGTREGAPAGLYSLAFPAVNNQVMAKYRGRGNDEHFFTGIAFLAGGCGNLAGSTRADEIHVVNPEDATDVMPELPLMLNGVLFDVTNGDMSIGPFLPCAVTTGE